MNSIETEAYDEGYEAYIHGQSTVSNPYWEGDNLDDTSREWYDWDSGWQDAECQFNTRG